MARRMARALSILFVLALGALLLLLPPARTADLAVLEVPRLLDAERVDAKKPTVWEGLKQRQLVLQQDGRAELLMETVDVRLEGDSVDDPATLSLARRSLARGLRQHAAEDGLSLTVRGEQAPPPAGESGARFRIDLDDGSLILEDRSAGRAIRVETPWSPPSRSSVLPPLVAIALAILLRRPVVSLLAGIVTAFFLLRLAAGSGVVASALLAVPDSFLHAFWPQVVEDGSLNWFRIQTVGFVVFMLGMVGIMTVSGGIRGLMDLVARFASNARSTQIATWAMGLVVFFDDYANCILVGSTMRPLSDRFRISREKLAYLVDSTAAPVAGLSLFSTWIAYEVSTFSAQLPAAGLLTSDGYSVFLKSLPYRFYCVLALFLGAWIAWTGRDFGPMLKAERRARAGGQVVREGGRPMVADEATSMEPAEGVIPAAHRALLPVLTFIGLTLVEILRVGWGALSSADASLSFASLLSIEGITELLSVGESTRALCLGSFVGMLLAAVLALHVGLRGEILDAAWTTFRAMSIAIVILYLAWMIGAACDAIGTASYLTVLLGDALQPAALPALLFLLAAVTALATGSSYSTMGILLPLVIGLAFNLGETSAIGGMALMLISIGAVLEGAIFGDHCSPISDTTVLSSTATAADHIDHVRTQAPYAVLVMTVALVTGYLPVAFLGLSPWISFAIGVLVLVIFLRLFGRRADEAPSDHRSTPGPTPDPT